jgi:hypothetical protein
VTDQTGFWFLNVSLRLILELVDVANGTRFPIGGKSDGNFPFPTNLRVTSPVQISPSRRIYKDEEKNQSTPRNLKSEICCFF